MEKNKVYILGGLALAAVVGYMLYDRAREKKAVEAAKDTELADAAKPSTATPGILPGEPSPLVKPSAPAGEPELSPIPGAELPEPLYPPKQSAQVLPYPPKVSDPATSWQDVTIYAPEQVLIPGGYTKKNSFFATDAFGNPNLDAPMNAYSYDKSQL